jgi:hypothetical protein
MNRDVRRSVHHQERMRRQSQEDATHPREEEERRVSQQLHQRQEVSAHQAQQQRASLDDESPTTVTNKLHKCTEQSSKLPNQLPLLQRITPASDDVDTSFELKARNGRSRGRETINNHTGPNLSPYRKMKPRWNINRDGGGGDFDDVSFGNPDSFFDSNLSLAGESYDDVLASERNNDILQSDEEEVGELQKKIILSFQDEYYKNYMYSKFRELGLRRDIKRYQVGKDILAEFKNRLTENGTLCKMNRNLETYAINDKTALKSEYSSMIFFFVYFRCVYNSRAAFDSKFINLMIQRLLTTLPDECTILIFGYIRGRMMTM